MNPTPRRNNEEPKRLNLKEIADLVGGELVGDASVTITGVAGIKEARQGDITFLSNPKYLAFLDKTRASAVVTLPEVSFPKRNLVRTENPSQAFTKIVSYFRPAGHFVPAPGVHPTAILGKNVRLEEGVSIGPHVFIGDESTIGEGTIIEANSFVGISSRIGRDSRIYPNVTLRENSVIGDRVIIHSGAVIGADGFGFEMVEGEHVKIPHTGYVLIEDDVEIGANVCIDRGRFGKTWIQRGVKIDNLVQVAHNVVVGENSILVSQCGISGSSELGKNVILAGQAGIVGHVMLGDDVVVGAGAGVTKSFPAKSTLLGSPARPIAEQKKIFALIARLPELFRELAELKKKLK